MTGRHLDERVALAAPGLTRLLARLVLKLRPGSRLRARALKRLSVRGWDAFARDDRDVALFFHDPDYEFNLFGDTFTGLGFAEQYRGHEGFVTFADAWRTAWSSIEVRVEQVFDHGDRIAIRFTGITRGLASGAEVSATSGTVYFLDKKAMIVRQDFYWAWADCAAAFGLDVASPD